MANCEEANVECMDYGARRGPLLQSLNEKKRTHVFKLSNEPIRCAFSLEGHLLCINGVL